METTSELLRPYEKVGKIMNYVLMEGGNNLTILEDMIWLNNSFNKFLNLKNRNPEKFQKMFLQEVAQDSSYYGMNVLANVYWNVWLTAKNVNNHSIKKYCENEVEKILDFLNINFNEPQILNPFIELYDKIKNEITSKNSI